MELFNNPLGIHERALQARSQRLELIAQNIANADTPQYKARDLDFKKS
jgi:flagellar basal-body rod protein FlgB